MGGVISAIGSAIGSVFGSVWNWICDTFTSVANFLYESVLTPIMNFLGFRDQKVVLADVSCAKVFQQNFLEETKVYLAIEKVKKDYSGVQYAKSYSTRGDLQLKRYFNYGHDYYMDYLPDVQIVGYSLNRKQIENTVKKYDPTFQSFIDCVTIVPNDTTWSKWQLQQYYGYSIDNDFCIINNTYCTFKSGQYNSSLNQYVITLTRLPNVKRVVYEGRYVQSKKELTQKKETDPKYEYTVKVETQEFIIQTDGRTLYTGSIEEVIDKVRTSEESIANTYIQKSEETLNSSAGELQVTVNSHNGNIYNVVTYRATAGTKLFLILSQNNGDYSSANPYTVYENIESYPICCLRRAGHWVTEYNDERRKQTIDLLDGIGIDLFNLVNGCIDGSGGQANNINAAFLCIGICTNNYTYPVSLMLFEMFDYYYDVVPPTDGAAYSAGFKELPFNFMIAWTARNTEYVDGKYKHYGRDLNKGECIHYITDTRITTSHYEEFVACIVTTGYGQGESDKKLIIYGGQRITEYQYSDDNTVSKKVDGRIPYQEYDGGYNGSDFFNESSDSYSAYQKYGRYAHSDSERMTLDQAVKKYGYTRIISSTEDSPSGVEINNTKNLTMVKQIDDNQYKRISICDVKATHIINGYGETIGVTLNVNDDRFIIPLSVEMVSRLSWIEKCALLGECVYLTFYSVKKYTIPWWATTAFSNFLRFLGMCITVIVSCFTMGSASAPAAALTNMLVNLLINVAVAVALNIALRLINLLVDDPYLKMALSAAAMVGAAWASGSLSFSSFDWSSAFEIANICTHATEIYLKEYTTTELSKIENKAQSLASEYEKRIKEFENATESFAKSLISTEMLANLNITSDTLTLAMESKILTPDDFFYLAIPASMNYDLMYDGLYNSVSNFCSMAIGKEQ